MSINTINPSAGVELSAAVVRRGCSVALASAGRGVAGPILGVAPPCMSQ